MKIYSSLSRDYETLSPPRETANSVGVYVCGITPYDSPHLGHARAAVVFDGFVRFLRYLGYAVTYVRNITDIDDKIIERAAGAGSSRTGSSGAGAEIGSFVERYITEYRAQAEALGCLLPDHEPRVSEHIPDIVALIERLIREAHAYESKGSVYFSVRTFDGYGRLSGRNVDELIEGARTQQSEEKKDPLDFALWKTAKPGEPSWSSPWGLGRPGWHIECSAMAMKYLGESFEIHGGGNDLIFPHHENERAQSEAVTGKPFARIWMHNGMITLGDKKMSKSTGIVLSVGDLLDRYGPRVLRFYLLSAHYASPLDFSEERLQAAESALDRFDTFLASAGEASSPPPSLESARDRAASVRADFVAALEDNFNTARAVAVLFEAIKLGNTETGSFRAALAEEIKRCGAMIGLELFKPRHLEAETGMSRPAIEALIVERDKARGEKNFARSDEIRKSLSERGIILEDTPTGTRWRK